MIPKKSFQKYNIKRINETKHEESPSVQKLSSQLIEIDTMFKKLKARYNESSNEILEHCLDLKSQVQLETEIFIQKVKRLCEDKIQEIEEYKLKCISIVESKIDQRFLQSIEDFKFEWSIYLKESSVDDVKIQKASKLASDYLRLIQENYFGSILDSLEFDASKMEFHINPKIKQLSSDILGSLIEIPKSRFNDTETSSIESVLPD